MLGAQHILPMPTPSQAQTDGPPAGVLKRLVCGALAGGFLGVLEIWFYEFSFRHFTAAIVSGALFVSFLGLAQPWAGRNATRWCFTGATLGAVAGLVWWAVVRPGNSMAFSMGVGLSFGFLWLLFNRNRMVP